MTQKPRKPAREMTTEEAVRRLFPKRVVERVKHDAEEAVKAPKGKRDPSMNED
jgi:hypothetical protein